MSEQVKKVAVIFGAGASHDVWSGLGHCNDNWKPPLAKDLFSLREDFHYEILARYPGARSTFLPKLFPILISVASNRSSTSLVTDSSAEAP